MEKTFGKLIVVEGLDGSGKSVQAKNLADNLKLLGYRVNLSAEPTNGPVGSLIRLALTNRISLDQKTIAALFAADRVDHVYNSVNGIKKHLDAGIIEISDRYDLTSYAYQTRFAEKDWVWQLNSQVIRPDLTIFLDASPIECLRRLAASKIEFDLFENEIHLSESRQNYIHAIETLRHKTGELIIVINAENSVDALSTQILEMVKDWLLNTGGGKNG